MCTLTLKDKNLKRSTKENVLTYEGRSLGYYIMKKCVLYASGTIRDELAVNELQVLKFL